MLPLLPAIINLAAYYYIAFGQNSQVTRIKDGIIIKILLSDKIIRVIASATDSFSTNRVILKEITTPAFVSDF